MKQKKIGDILYVYSTTAYEITQDTDAAVIKIQEECIPAYAALNASLVSKFQPINYKLFCVKHPEWADYMDDYYVHIASYIGEGTATATPNSGDEGEEITLSATPATGWEFVRFRAQPLHGSVAITVKDNKFTMPADDVRVQVEFDKIDFDITVDDTIQNGSLSAPETANLGDTVTITATPASGYKLDTLTVMCGSLEITVVNNQFTMPAGDVTVTGTFRVLTYADQYFTIESEADNNEITINLGGENPDSTSRNSFSVSSDNGSHWTTIELNEGNYVYSTTLNEGDKLLIKSTNTTFSINTDDSMITSSGNFKVYGNIMSLLYGDNFANQTSFPANSSYNFQQLFYYCTCLTDASNLILPATTLTEGCYNKMFCDCGSLTTPPKLPATTVVSNAYNDIISHTQITELIMLATSINFSENYLGLPDTNGTAYVNPNADSTIRSYFTSSGWTVQDYVPNV